MVKRYVPVCSIIVWPVINHEHYMHGNTFQDDWSEVLTLYVIISIYGHYIILMKGIESL